MTLASITGILLVRVEAPISTLRTFGVEFLVFLTIGNHAAPQIGVGVRTI